MTSLVSIINFLVVYLRYLVLLVLGGTFNVSDFAIPEQQSIARSIILQVSMGLYENSFVFLPRPLLLLIIGIVVFGAVIGLSRRLIRG